MQDAVNKQDPQGMEASRTVNDAVNSLKTGMRAVGVNVNAEQGTREAGNIATLESGLRDKLIAAQQAKSGAPLSSNEARGIALRHAVEHALYGSGQSEWSRRLAGKSQMQILDERMDQ